MFGIDDAAIAAIIAAVAGAGLQYKATSDAASKTKREAVAAQQRQLMAQNEATQVAAQRAAAYDPTTRQANQQQIQQQLGATYDQPVNQPQITAQGVQVGSTIPDSAGTGDYLMAKAKEQAKTAASLHALAGLMSRIGAASDLRRGEAVGMGDTAGEIGRIQNGAGHIFGADQVGINAAGQLNPGLMFAGAGLKAYGAAGASGTGNKYPDYGSPSGPTGGWV